MQMQASATARRSPLSAYAAGTQAVTFLRFIIEDMAAQAAVGPSLMLLCQILSKKGSYSFLCE